MWIARCSSIVRVVGERWGIRVLRLRPCRLREYNRGGSGLNNIEVHMPIYEYVCRDCKKEFSEMKPVSAHDPKKVKCPKCKSRGVERRWSTVTVTTSRKS